MNPESLHRENQPPAPNSFQVDCSKVSWLKRVTSRLSISRKIQLGYILILSIAVVGTTAGLTIGNHWENQAKQELEKWHETGILLNNLQVAVLRARSHQQQLITLLSEPVKYKEEHEHFISYINRIKTLFTKIESWQGSQKIPEVKNFIHNYEGTTENYFQQIQVILSSIDSANLKAEQITEAQNLILNFNRSEIALKFDGVSDDLTKIIDETLKKEAETKVILEQGEVVQIYTPIASMLLSVGLAVFLAIYTSRAIARPLKAATDVAQLVTKNANFNLQVPVTTEDEVGILAASLNELIAKVRHLLIEQKAAIAQQKKMQESQLLQSEKMSSLGRILAGVAHEINNPVNFIYGNITHAIEYVDDLLELLKIYQIEVTDPPLTIYNKAEEIDLEFLEEDLPKVLQSMTVGADRVRQIILSLKDFSRLDEVVSQSVNLHACLDSTLLILQNRLKKGITIVRNYGDIPEIEGYTGFLYQVFMNLLTNAMDALEENLGTANPDMKQSKQSKQIVITTERLDKNWVMVRISDNGSGIPTEIQTKIFETFFTTKPRGVGTGLGLAISRQIVEEKHGGRITCTSNVGEGTEFAIALPIKGLGATP